MNQAKPPGYSRRKFLISTGWLAVGTTVVFQSGCSLPSLPTLRDNPEEDAMGWIQVQPDNQIIFYMGKAEMGQGVLTGLTQLVAEELQIPPGKMSVRLPTTKDVKPVKMTVASESIQDLYLPVRKAAASLRETLRNMAARKFKMNEDQIQLVEGGFRINATGKVLSFGEIVRGHQRIKLLDSSKISLKPGKGNMIGQSVPRLDIPAKIDGTARYTHDVSLPGMLWGAVLHPPVFGAYLKSAEAEEAEKLPGVVKVVISKDHNFVGVVAESDQISRDALGRIKAEWNIPKIWQQKDIDEILDIKQLKARGSSPHLVLQEGSAEKEFTHAHQKLELSFSTPFGAHAQMETHAAVADVTTESVDLWVGSQDAFFQAKLAADITGLSKDNVTVHPTLLGGGYGGKVFMETTAEAVRLSHAVKRPVKVVWTREENLRHTYFRPPTRHHIRAGLDREGKVSSWHHELSSGLVIFGPGAASSKLMKWVTSFVADRGGSRGSLPPYDFLNQTIAYWDESLPVPTGPWRALGASVNAFAVESTMDELARMAKQDPLEFRLAHLKKEKHQRLKGVLQAVAKLSDWGKTLPDNVGRGIACGIYNKKTLVAVVAQVRLNRKTGKIRLEKLYCAHDCGRVINPDSVKAQVEGNLIWGASMALVENLLLKDGKMEAVNFHQYPILRLSDAPDIEVVLVENPVHPPSGAGEPALMPTPAAIANAISSVAGKRITSLPITPLSLKNSS